jgi:hypothetical protein
MKLEVGKTYEDDCGTVWEIVYQLAAPEVPYRFVGLSREKYLNGGRFFAIDGQAEEDWAPLVAEYVPPPQPRVFYLIFSEGKFQVPMYYHLSGAELALKDMPYGKIVKFIEELP